MKVSEQDLLYSATSRCRCGAGLTYFKKTRICNGPGHTSWVCSAVLKNEVGQPDVLEGKHTLFPFMSYEIKSETQPSANGMTTRPSGTAFRYRWYHLLMPRMRLYLEGIF